MTNREKIAASLKELGLKEYDWNGSGGLPAREDALDLALAVFALNDYAFKLIDHVDEYTVTLNEDGTVEVGLDNGDRTLLLTFQCGGAITYIKVFDDEQTTVEGTIRINPDWPFTAYDGFADLAEALEWIGSETE